MAFDPAALRASRRPHGLPFKIAKIGHIVLNVRDLGRSVHFYTQVLGFSVSDVYPPEIVPGGMAFMRCNTDHHGVALVGSLAQESPHIELHHVALRTRRLHKWTGLR
jgi:catechol-2,3-dioxygenase